MTGAGGPRAFNAAERARIVRALRAGEAPACPLCGRALGAQSIEPRSDLAYSRRRLWLRCAPCDRATTVDAVTPRR